MVKFKKILSFKDDPIEGEIIQLGFIADIESELIVTVHSIGIQNNPDTNETAFEFLYDSDTKLCQETDDELRTELINVFLALFEDALLDEEYEQAIQSMTKNKKSLKLQIVK